jgi:hypothetical protein
VDGVDAIVLEESLPESQTIQREMVGVAVEHNEADLIGKSADTPDEQIVASKHILDDGHGRWP